MILLSSPLKNDPLETTVSIYFFLEIEIFTTKIVNSKSLKKICCQLLSTMNVLKQMKHSGENIIDHNDQYIDHSCHCLILRT